MGMLAAEREGQMATRPLRGSLTLGAPLRSLKIPVDSGVNR